MTKVIRKRTFRQAFFAWGLPIALYLSLLLFALTSGWWQAAILAGYFMLSFVLYISGRIGTVGVIFLSMLPAIEAKIKALETWQDEAPKRVLAQVQDREPDVVELNYEEQLFRRGIRADGKQITPAYTPFTTKLKGYKGQPTDRVTLRDTGDFHASFLLEFEANEFRIFAADWKEGKLKAKYGEEILGLTDKNIQRVIEWIRDPVLNDFRKLVL